MESKETLLAGYRTEGLAEYYNISETVDTYLYTIHTYVHTHINRYTYIHVHTYIHAYVRTYVRTYVLTYTHTVHTCEVYMIKIIHMCELQIENRSERDLRSCEVT